MKKVLLIVMVFLVFLVSVNAATLKGSIYDTSLNLEEDVLIEVNSEPSQKFLTKDGSYTFELDPGSYTLTARKGLIEITEKIKISKEGIFIYDLFLLADFTTEDTLWDETNENLFDEEKQPLSFLDYLRYLFVLLIVIYGSHKFLKVRKKYGTLPKFRKKVKEERKKTVNDHKKDIEEEPGYLEDVIELLKKNDGRISQKKLRREMLHLSEAKVSLILTELEHKGRVEKVKKGRGNVILLKE